MHAAGSAVHRAASSLMPMERKMASTASRIVASGTTTCEASGTMNLGSTIVSR